VLKKNNFTSNAVGASSYGGAVFTDGSPNMLVTENVFSKNFAGWGVFTWNCSTMEEPRGLVLTNKWDVHIEGIFPLPDVAFATTAPPVSNVTVTPTAAPTASPTSRPTSRPTTFLENILWASTIFSLQADDSVR